MKHPLVSIIIVTFNNAVWLEKCLNNLLHEQTYQLIEILVTNNGTEESVAKVKKKYASVHFIQNSHNEGFGKAANRGIQASKGNYVLIYNDDAICDKDFITKLVSALESDQNVGAVQGTLLSYDRKHIVESVGSYFTPTGILWKETGFVYIAENLHPHYIFNANLPLIRKTVLDKVGLFDEDYFLYFEETDLCWRIWQSGSRIMSVPTAKVWHKAGMTTKRMVHAFVIESTYANRINSLIKNLEGKHLLFILPLHMVFCLISAVSFLVLGKWQIAFAIGKAIARNIWTIGHTLQKRKKVRALRQVDDTTVFRYGMKPMRFDYLFRIGKTYFREW